MWKCGCGHWFKTAAEVVAHECKNAVDGLVVVREWTDDEIIADWFDKINKAHLN